MTTVGICVKVKVESLAYKQVENKPPKGLLKSYIYIFFFSGKTSAGSVENR